jgi:hypothetical protein
MEQKLTYVDYWSVLSASDGGMKRGFYDDGVHPNVNGYRAMEPLAKTAITKALQYFEFPPLCPSCGQPNATTIKLLVCYRAVTALMVHFCKNAFAPREAMAAGSPRLGTCGANSVADQLRPLDHGVRRPPTTPGQFHRGHGTAAAYRCTEPLRRGVTCGLRIVFLLCATTLLLNTCQGRRRAHAALKPWGLLEQRRDLGTCPTFIPLNAEFVACRTLKMESLRSVPLRCITPS